MCSASGQVYFGLREFTHDELKLYCNDKEIFLRHGFHIVYDKDRDEHVSDGFFYTIGRRGMTSAELLRELLLYGICAISLTSTGSHQEGIRVCISQMNRPEQFDMLDERLALFAQNHKD